MSNIYQIRNLHCKYKQGKNPVLVIDELNIKEGKIVFFIGASGVGKSTILETLGLMNNTISKQEKTEFNFKQENVTIDLLSIWNKGEKNLSAFRRKHLSFIFQNTNLFGNLTMYQNANITQVLQGKTEMEAIRNSTKFFKNILSDIVGNTTGDRKITEMSGGQRQRLAFTRAISTNYSVLFADEPTGNLDYANAHNLMKILAENIRINNKTSVIVSHDIALAIEFADEIVLIDKRKSSDNTFQFGLISNETIYKKNGSNWLNMDIEIDSKNLINVLKNKIIKQAE
jgi:ABC-type lipoprotein export system ATPase subunit